MYCLPTPYSILNDPDDGEDVFKTIFPDSETFCIEKRLAMWSRFHDTGIGNADQVYWMRAMKAKAAEIEGRYAIRFRVWQEYQERLAQAQSVDLSDGKIKSKSTAKHYDPPSGSSALSSYVSEGDSTDFEQNTYGGLEPETLRQYGDAVENPFETWAKEFDKLFYWGL